MTPLIAVGLLGALGTVLCTHIRIAKRAMYTAELISDTCAGTKAIGFQDDFRAIAGLSGHPQK